MKNPKAALMAFDIRGSDGWYLTDEVSKIWHYDNETLAIFGKHRKGKTHRMVLKRGSLDFLGLTSYDVIREALDAGIPVFLHGGDPRMNGIKASQRKRIDYQIMVTGDGPVDMLLLR